jgi:hypothetical protein
LICYGLFRLQNGLFRWNGCWKNPGEKHHVVLCKTMEYVQAVKAAKKIKIINDMRYLTSLLIN